MLEKASSSSSPRVVIVGAGIGGLTLGIDLKKKLGFHNFTIYEQSDDVGGTWHDNTYPGCGADVEVQWYSLSTEPNPYFSAAFVPQSEIKDYWVGLAKKYSLYDNTSLNTNVLSSTWDASRQLYAIELENVLTGERKTDYAQVFISAIGALHAPNYPPDLDSIKNFKGEHFHSARWNHKVRLHNKRVAVIGNGCSAAQFIPKISEDPTTEVVNFCRSSAWFLNIKPPAFTPWTIWKFVHIPLYLKIHRALLMVKHELAYVLALTGGPDNKFRKKIAASSAAYIRSTAPEKYHKVLIPDYEFGCKRPIVDSGYLEALNRPNLDLNYDDIASFTDDGIITKKGEHISFDVIIFGTGFEVDGYPIYIRGQGGKTIEQFYEEQGGPTAYFSTALPGFPNFFMILGPNANGHGSIMFLEEVQINYILNVIKPVLQKSISSFEVTAAATDRYNKFLDSRLKGSVFTGCSSWYRVAGTGKISRILPITQVEYWWRLRNVKWNDYSIVGGDAWERRRRILRVGKNVGVVGLVFAAIWARRNWKDVRELWQFVLQEISKSLGSVVSQSKVLL
ncbi:hypothetical protein C8Q75DRAFT_802839 [Abortiporus biennis]|nr:hypothetical protein C8Q75DRAFT_802839 [Abortiporus biennis]